MARNHYDWASLIEMLKVTPNRWVLAFPDHPARLVASIRLQRHPDLRRDDGLLEATLVNRYIVPGFAARGDVWVRWVPVERKEEDESG